MRCAGRIIREFMRQGVVARMYKRSWSALPLRGAIERIASQAFQ